MSFVPCAHDMAIFVHVPTEAAYETYRDINKNAHKTVKVTVISA